jgi:glycerol-3-phosphate dehydrogenase (NAD(P)+)
MAQKERIVVLGAGSWGATLAALLSEKGHDLCLWEFDPAIAASLATSRRLSVLPDLAIPSTIRVTSDMKAALAGRPLILSATPSHFVRSTMRSIKNSIALDPKAVFVSATKGLEEKTFLRMSQVIAQELDIPAHRVAVLSGPSHAEEVCRRMPTAVVLAGRDSRTVERLRDVFQADFFRVYPHQDLIGVELAGAIKNIFAIVCGIADGLGLGDNSRAAILTRGLNEMTRIGVKLGGEAFTFFGLAGMGDLIVTCMSRHSRNRLLGQKIGQGKSAQEALAEMTMVAEGMKTAPSVYQLSKKLKLDCPLTHEIYQVLYRGKDPKISLHDLMRRATRDEWQGLKSLQRKRTK